MVWRSAMSNKQIISKRIDELRSLLGKSTLTREDAIFINDLLRGLIRYNRPPKRVPQRPKRVCTHEGCTEEIRREKQNGLCHKHEPRWCNGCEKLVAPEQLFRYRSWHGAKKINGVRYKRVWGCKGCRPDLR